MMAWLLVITLGHDEYNLRGLVHSYLSQYPAALRDYEHDRALQANPFRSRYNSAVVLVRWPGILAAQDGLDTARTAMEAIRNTAEHAAALYGLGGLDALLSHSEAALDYLTQARHHNAYVLDRARHDITWRDLRRDPRFQAIIRRPPQP